MSVDSPIEQTSALKAESAEYVAEKVVDTVGRIHLDLIGEAEVRAMVEQEWRRYEHATVRHFVPVLVHRAVIEQLAHHPAIGPAVR